MKNENYRPLTDAQIGIYLECVNKENPAEYFVPAAFSFKKDEIDAEKLAVAFNKVVKNYSAFSIVISEKNSQPVMSFYNKELPEIQIIKAKDNEIKKIKSEYFEPFTFDGELLWRAVTIESESYVIMNFVAHHLIFDGTSVQVLNKALADAYEEIELSCETKTLFDAQIEEEAMLKSDISKEAEMYFEKYMNGIESDSNIIPDKAPKEKEQTFKAVYSEVGTSKDEIFNFAKANSVSENVVILSAFAYSLAKFNNNADAVFSSVESGRFGGGYENSMGMFVKTFPLRFRIDEKIKASDYVKAVKKNYIDTLKHNHTKYSDIVSEYPTCANTMYVFEGEMFNGKSVSGAIPQIDTLDSAKPVSDFEFVVYAENNNFKFRIGYKENLYSKEIIESFVELFSCVLKEIISDKMLCDFNLVSAKSKALLDSFNKTETDIDTSETINDIFDKTVENHKNNTAVVYKDKKYTYAQFDSVTKKIASYVNGKGIGKNDFVGVLIPRNEFMPITAYGIIRAGAAYQPLDPTYPEERLNFMLKDSKTRLLIADRSLINLVSEYKGDVLFTDEIEALPESEDFVADVKPDNAFVLIYTSGTTGTPKGCILENKNVVSFYYNHRKVIELSENSRVATVASFGFDAAVQDIFTTISEGATLYIIPEEIKLDIPQLEKFYIENEITNGFMTTQLGRMFLEQTKSGFLKEFMLGGEKLVPFTPPKNVKCLNGYGPSETLAYVCNYTIKNNSTFQPIGKASDNTKLYITDSNKRLLPAGAVGELCVAGLQVGRGYFERPEKTADVFIDNPFSCEKGYERIYRTGDIVRLLPDGNVDFIGRRDGQVKIRGFRIELTEVEQIIREFDGIKNATVQAYDDPVSGKYIAAFIVSDNEIDISKLNSFILEQKPPYMVPAVTMQLDKIPVNANGKVDKKKLPKPERKVEKIILPKNEMQQKIFDAVSAVIGTDKFSIDTDFYLLGLSSIGSIKLCSLIADEFNISIQMKDLKQNNTVIELEKFILNAENEDSFESEILSDYPLTKTQEGIFVECISKPGSTLYNIPLLLKLSDKIDTQKLKTAIVSAVNAHPYIKTELFTDDNGNIRQRRMDDAEYTENDIEEIFCNNIDEIKNSAILPFELTDSRLFRFKLYHFENVFLSLDIHHIIADGSSINILLNSIEKAYNGDEISAEKYSAYDLSLNEENRRKTDELNEANTYYDNLLNGLDMSFLPGGDRLSTKEKSNGKIIINQTLSDMAKIKEYCSKNGVSVNGLLCSVFGFVLAKYSGTEYSVFNTVYNGRNDSRSALTVGMLVKTLPVVCNIEKEMPIEISKEISAQLVDSMANDLYSYAEISKNYGVKNEVMFIYQGDDFEFNKFCGEDTEEIPLNLSESKAPFTVQASVSCGKLKYDIEYNSDLFTEEFIKVFASSFDKALYSFINNEKVSGISLLTDDVVKALDEFNNNEYEYDTSKTIVDHFIESVDLYPEKGCVVYKDKKYTFSEVYDISSRVASFLNSKGIGKNDVVSILINRDENMVLSAYGVILSGAAYLGLDPTYPQDRLKFMIEDSGSKIVIADRSLIGIIDGYEGDVLYVDEFCNLPKASDDLREKVKDISPEDNALIIYSSGTTGIPKGSVLRHQNIVCFFINYTLDNEMDSNSNIATYASFGFDGGAMDVFSSPMAGATLYIIPDEIRLDIEKLEQFYVTNKITNGFMTTQVGTMFISSTKCETLKHFMVGGEKFIPSTPPKWVTLYNGYGPSETMCYVNKFKVFSTEKLQPIGKVNRNLKEYIVDKFGNRLPFGACGELCISGGQTGKGYLNRPSKTAEVFVENPFCNVEPYKKMYRTGDIVRLLPDGNYDFVGRRDGQVKIRGFRIELTEVEGQIRKFKGIENAAVQAYDSNSGGKYLAAFIVADTEINIDELNEFIASEKPDYMVPAVTMQIDEIPLTANGKVDKKKLPQPSTASQKKGAEPANETEEAICEIYGEILGLDKVYADDDFFHIGGSSISAIQVVVKCNNAGYDIVFKNLFANPTPHLLSEYIHGGRSEITYAPGEEEAEKYDYSALEYNTVENIDKISFKAYGNVLLTGVTGFLGSHLLKELLESTSSDVICLIRGKSGLDAETRLQMMMAYYFEDWYTEELSKRVIVVEGGLGDKDVLNEIKKYKFDLIMNSAANVKHFAAGDALITDNFSGVQNLIKLAEETNAKLIQISSTSVSGEANLSNISEGFLFKENHLNIGQSLENRYIFSKYQAEQAVIDSISKGKIKGKIIRLGNLMARIDDSEFQINAGSNGFLRQFTGYNALGMFPVDVMDRKVEFSPIDSVAKSIVLLSGTPDEFTVFHAKNCNNIHFGYLVDAMIKEGLNIKVVKNDVFEEKYQKALSEEKNLSDFTSLIAYVNSNKGDGENKISHQIESDATFTAKALYRLGFSWPLISEEYLRKMVRALIELGFFDL